MCSWEKRGAVYVLTLTGPGEHRLNPTLLSAIRSALAEICADASSSSSSSLPRGRALVLSGEGKFFSNGFDLAWARAFPADGIEELSRGLRGVAADLLALPMPTVAAVTGHAVAAGVIVTLMCDYRVMRSDRGFLYMSELDIGLPFPRYFMMLLRSKVADPVAARRVLLQAGKLTAAEAEKLGLVDATTGTAQEALQEAIRMAGDLAAKGWDGQVYASIRMAAFREAAEALGLVKGAEEEMAEIKARL